MIRLAVVAAAVLAAGAGCDCGSKKPAAKAETGERGAAAHPPRRAPGPRAPERTPPGELAGRVRHSAPLTVEDATAVMPPLDARPLGPPALAPNGQQVRFSYCVDADDLATAARTLAEGVERAGWGNVTARAPGEGDAAARHGIAADKGDLRVSITVQGVRRSGCDESVNQFFAVATLNRIAAGGDQSPSPEPAP